MKSPRIAIVHELLTMKGGAERVAKHLADHFPEAPIYTLLYDKKAIGDWFDPARVRTSRLQKYAWLSTNHHLYLKKFPATVEAWDFADYDLVISSSSAFAHGIITNGKPQHLSYVHAPARYLWDRYLDIIHKPTSNPLKKLQTWWFKQAAHKLRIWDSEAADRPDTLVAVSNDVQRRIRLYWNRDSIVINPPIEDHWFEHELNTGKRSGFITVSTLAPYKRIDLAIEACNTLNAPLTIVGSGPDEQRLRKIAGPNVTFKGRLEGSALTHAVSNAEGYIVAGEEDFGLAPMEALTCGTPVIAYEKGGLTETIDASVGTFFTEPTAASLQSTLQNFKPSTYNPATCRKHAEPYRVSRFLKSVDKEIEKLLQNV